MEKGDKVYCINDKFVLDKNTPKEYRDIELPVKKKLYTIRKVVTNEYGTGFRLEEIKNPKIYHDKGGWEEPIFGEERFKKTIGRTLKEML
jgi:hypothetical protein